MRFAIHVILVVGLLACTEPDPGSEPGAAPAAKWWKGNLHTHSLWSDGDDYPEQVVNWYKSRGYHFLAISDHNVLHEGDHFIDTSLRGGGEVLAAYKECFPDWVAEKEEGGAHLVQLRTLEEYRPLFEEPGVFLLFSGEEITDGFDGKPIHVNATNIVELIGPQGGDSVRDVMQNNVDAVLEQRERTGQLMFPHINHPNYGWAIKVEDLMALRGEKFFEVYNGHPQVHNEGDDAHPSTARMWDIALAERLSAGEPIMYGLTVDDAHVYYDLDSEHANPGRGWVMVRAAELSTDAIIRALEAGEFYGSSGVTLDDVQLSSDALSLVIDADEEDGIDYVTQFIGTRRGYDRTTEEVHAEDASVLFRYSETIGEVLATVPGALPSYTFRGDELYVRAKVVSSKLKNNPYKEGEYEAAWVQPVVVVEFVSRGPEDR